MHERENGEQAAELMQQCVLAEHCLHQPLVLHADNGGARKSSILQVKLAELGFTPSHSRPRVSNDNAFAESLFRTLKYCPQWPTQGFFSLSKASDWVNAFIDWYNNQHRYSRIRFVTPAQPSR